STLTIVTRRANIVGAYFTPNTEPEVIIDELGRALENTEDSKPTFLEKDYTEHGEQELIAEAEMKPYKILRSSKEEQIEPP
ncbi:hypothetical protein L9F63_012406, partial [Diploptera punctata]